MEKVDDAAEILLGADGQVEGKRSRREVLTHRADRAVEVGVLLVELVDHHDARLAGSVAELPRDLGPHRELRARPDHHDSAFRHTQPAEHLAGEIEEPGGVQDVDLVAAVLGETDAQVDRDLPFLFLGLEVHRRGRLVGRAHPGDGAGGEEHRLGQRGLAVVRVAQQDHVSDLVGSVLSRHPNPHQKRPRSFTTQV